MTGWKRDACLPLACSWSTPWTAAARTSGAPPRLQRRRTPPRTRRSSSTGRRRIAATLPPRTRRGLRPREGMQASSYLPAAVSAHLKPTEGQCPRPLAVPSNAPAGVLSFQSDLLVQASCTTATFSVRSLCMTSCCEVRTAFKGFCGVVTVGDVPRSLGGTPGRDPDAGGAAQSGGGSGSDSEGGSRASLLGKKTKKRVRRQSSAAAPLVQCHSPHRTPPTADG